MEKKLIQHAPKTNEVTYVKDFLNVSEVHSTKDQENF